MTRTLRNAALAAFAALAFGATPGAAQTTTYCNGRIAADRFYSYSRPATAGTQFTYYVTLRNTTQTGVDFGVVFNHTASTNRQSGQVTTLPGGRSTEVVLGTHTTASGAGLNAQDLARSTTVTCR